MQTLTPEQALTSLSRLEQFVDHGDFSEVLGFEVANTVYAGIERNFLDESSPQGAPWAPLKPATIARKRRKNLGTHNTILIDTGAMLRAATGGPGSILNVGYREAIFGINGSIPYAGFHMTGTSRMPARPYFGLDLEFVDRIRGHLGAFLARKAVP